MHMLEKKIINASLVPVVVCRQAIILTKDDFLSNRPLFTVDWDDGLLYVRY